MLGQRISFLLRSKTLQVKFKSMYSVKLNTGAKMPVIGLGTWKSKPGEVRAAVETAIETGYRHIDCAFIYGNENEVGEAIQAKINEGIVKREDLFITTKLWITYHHPEKIKECLLMSLAMLKLDYVDLFLMHWSFALQYTTPDDYFPVDENKHPRYDESLDYVDVWKGMEEAKREGLTRAIGVCNFNRFQISRILKEGSIVPAIHQYECHPYLHQEKMLQFCKSNGITVTGYSSFGSPDRPWAKPDDPSLLENPVMKKIAEKYGKTTAQVLLRYQIERGLIVLPKSVTPSRVISNFKVFDFKLDSDDKAEIQKQERNWRAVPLEMVATHKYYPFRDDYSE